MARQKRRRLARTVSRRSATPTRSSRRNGAVAEQGTHHELIRSGGTYAGLAKLQEASHGKLASTSLASS